MAKVSAKERALVWAILAVALALPWAAEALGEGFAVGLVTRILIFALAAISLNLILGYGGLVSFGHAAFFGTGAYVVAILAQHAALGEPLLTWPVTLGGSDSALNSVCRICSCTKA